MDEENNEKKKNRLLEEGKGFAKNAILKKLTPFIIKGVAIILIGVFIVGVAFAIFDKVGEAVWGKLKPIIAGVQEFFTLDDGGAITINDEQIDEIINAIDSLGVSMDGLKLLGDVDYTGQDKEKAEREALRKYIRKFYEAQAMTQTLNTKPNWVEENILNGGKVYGTVYVHRETEETTSPTHKNQLEYIKYDEMLKLKERIEKGGGTNTADIRKIMGSFSVDEEGKLVVAGWSNTVVKKDGRTVTDQTMINLKAIDYKNAISQYTTSMDFFIYLTMISQNPEFVSAVVDLVKQSDIRITLMDKEDHNTSIEDYTYTVNKKWIEEITNERNEVVGKRIRTSSSGKEEITETITTSINPTVAVTYAKTWFGEQTVTYNKTEEGSSTSSDPIQIEPDDPEPAEEGEWITDKYIQVDTTEKETHYEEGLREKVIDKTGNRGDGKTSFIGLLDVGFRIPNETKEARAWEKLNSGAQQLFYLLRKDPSTQNLEQVMRFIINKYKHPDKYDQSQFDEISEIFSIRMLTTGTNYIVNTLMSSKDLCITDKETLIQAIEKVYSGQMKENLVNNASAFIQMQEEYHVNAVFAIAVTVVESSAGTNWGAISPSTHNWCSVTGSYEGKTYKNDNSANPLTWRVYPNFRVATLDFGDVIANSSYYFRVGRNSVEEIAPVYCNTDWGISVIAVMNEIYAAAGIELPDEGFIVGGVTSDEAAKQLQGHIETSLIRTRVHKGNSAYQRGPFATWWSPGYNNLQAFQCTWWANGRASMYLSQNGTKYKRYPTQTGNGGDYYNINKENKWFKYGKEPRPNSIISWSNGSYGHVAYVEGVTADGIYISHAGSGTSWYGVQKIPLDGSLWNGYKLNGYIYLDQPM